RVLPLSAVHDAAKRVGANVTLNDAMVALVGSGVASWLAEQGRASQPLRVRVPVSLHGQGDVDAANRDSFIDVDVSLDGTDVVARLRFISAQTKARKAAHDAEHVDRLMRAMAALPFGEHLVAMSDGAQQFSLCLSNVVGPRQPIAVDGVPVSSLHSFVEVAEHHDLRASVISCADRLSLTLCADADRVDPEAVMRGVDAAWDRLDSAA
ncbi:MAG: WS/DGAT domain-containing protein, partial [Candidatus Dormibacteria bacterium]